MEGLVLLKKEWSLTQLHCLTAISLKDNTRNHHHWATGGASRRVRVPFIGPVSWRPHRSPVECMEAFEALSALETTGEMPLQ